MLCRVMAMTKRMLLCQPVRMPSAWSMAKPGCRWGRTLSMIHRKRPPRMKPVRAGTQAGTEDPSAIWIAGASRDQKLAAVITPAAKPSIPSRTLRFTVLNTKTRPAPAAVTPHVKQVASKACRIGLCCLNQSMVQGFPTRDGLSISWRPGRYKPRCLMMPTHRSPVCSRGLRPCRAP